MVIQGNPSREDVFQISKILIPELDDFALNSQHYETSYFGIIQIILLANLSNILKNRILR